MTLDPDQRGALEQARAVGLARDWFEIDAVNAESTAFGTVVRGADLCCIVVASNDLAVLGGVLVWVERNRVTDVVLVAEHNSGIHARRAATLAPEMTVWKLSGNSLSRAEPAPIQPLVSGPDDVGSVVAMIERAGGEVVIEDGILRAEVAGLEVARVVDGPSGKTLEVGIGRFDREAGALLHAARPTESTLAAVIERVKPHRSSGAVSHAMNRIGRERWIRHVVRCEPGLVGLVNTELVEAIPARAGLLEVSPAALLGTDGGSRVLAVCSVGVDLGLVPSVADLMLRHDPDEIRLVLPDRDLFPYLSQLIGRLPVATRLVGIDPPWID